mmetsp:Transcript_50936/g.81304  ORF Transcript_50936/g.81304 Transcript_50936/m.81304 type:complete len:166 (-) Transcript_50936:14-511(-)
MAGQFYGAEKFNPRLISTQILVMQSSFWLCFCSCVSVGDLFFGEEQGAGQLFQPEAYTWRTTRGLILACALWLTSFVMAVELRFVVQRAKKCLDFVATYHIFHLMATCLAEGFPAFWQWWIIQVPAMLISVLLGEFMCMRAETQDISLGTKGGSKKPSKPTFDEI